MSTDLNLHEAQSLILHELLFVPSGSFAELRKPTGLTSDHFNFHIGRLVELGMVRRMEKGHYALTPGGKEYANRMDTDEKVIERLGKVAVLIVPTRQAGERREYLVQQRRKQPFFGRHCYMTGKLRWGEQVLEGAARELMEESGLSAHLEVKGVHHKLDYTTDGTSLEDKHFYIVQATHVVGEMTTEFPGGANFWMTMEEIMALENVFDDMDRVIEIIDAPELVFWEKSYRYSLDEY